jgi:hypothetical protein
MKTLWVGYNSDAERHYAGREQSLSFATIRESARDYAVGRSTAESRLILGKILILMLAEFATPES